MKVFVALLRLALTSSLAIAVAYPRQQSQTVPADDDFFIQTDRPAEVRAFMMWDGVRNEFISYGAYQRQQYRPLPIINIYPVSGQKRSINILTNFLNARSVRIDSLAVGPDGSVLVACGLDIPSSGRLYALERALLFDGLGALVTDFSAVPDDVSAMAIDGQGTMYILGMHENEKSPRESYPLIVGYDEYGHVAREMLPRSLFADSDDPVGDALGDLLHGGSRLAVTNNAVEAYLAPLSEFIVLDRSGNIQTRVSVPSRLFEFAQDNGYENFYVDADEFSPSGDLWIVGHLADPLDNGATSLSARNFVVLLTPQGVLQAHYDHVGQEPPGHYLPTLIGFTKLNEPVAFVWDASPDKIHLRKNPY